MRLLLVVLALCCTLIGLVRYLVVPFVFLLIIAALFLLFSMTSCSLHVRSDWSFCFNQAHADNAFSTLLTPDLEPLGGAVGKRGTVTFSLASATAILSYSITHDVTDATAIHLHDLNTGGVLYTWAATPAAAMVRPWSLCVMYVCV